MRRLASALFLAAFAAAQTPGPQVLTFLSGVDDSDQPYAVYVPKGYSAGKKYPLVVSLHGAGSNHRLNLRRVFGKGNVAGETGAEATRYWPSMREVEFLVASPYARGTMGYQGIAEQDVYDVLADVERRFSVDEDRVYLTGLSMGGGGTLWLGLTRPDVWAALAPVCPAPPPGAEDLAPNALNLPVHLFHGEADPVVPVSVSRTWQKRLLDLGSPAEYVEYPNVRHNAWDHAYQNGSIFDWFAKFRRQRFPGRVRFVSTAYKYNTAYWVRLDGFTPGTLASIDVRFTGRNTVTAATSNLRGFTLHLAGHPQFAAGALRVIVDGVALSMKTAGTVSFRKSAGVWQPGSEPPAAKRAGAEGPLAEAVASRHIYVYGTADSPPPDELKRRREVAERAADWNTSRFRLMLSFAVKADRDVTEKDMALANLVLFGTRETNRVVARLAPQLPLALNPGAADYGLVFVAPVGNRYVLVNSGLPFWTGAEELKSAPLSALKPVPRLLARFGDFVLFKGSLARIVAEGRFDDQWKVPAGAASALRESGTVTIQP